MSPSEPPLTGVRVVELAGLAPAPFASLLLADYGASILRIDRPHPDAHSSHSPPPTPDLLTRHKSSIALDLKSSGAVALLKTILNCADVFIEPFRPGVLESLGLDPESLLAANPRLVIARLTGFRRDGAYARMAGHDINYLAVSGILSQLGRANAPPYAPANILADFAGGGLMKGEVVETNMVDGSAYLGTFMRYGTKTPLGDQPRGQNILDGGCPWYEVYDVKMGGFMAVGALEEKFFHELIRGLGLNQALISTRYDRSTFPALKEIFRQRFREKTRRQWEEIFAGKDACCTPVLTQAELEDKGFEQRLAVELTGSPGLDIPILEAWSTKGLLPGFGGERILEAWTGLHKDRDYKIQGGGLIKVEISKL